MYLKEYHGIDFIHTPKNDVFVIVLLVGYLNDKMLFLIKLCKIFR